MGLADHLRLILVHKQKTSARLRFLRFAHGLTAFSPLPKLSSLLDEEVDPPVLPHPAALLREAEERLGLAHGSLALEPEFHAIVDSPGGPIVVYLASFTCIDPPFAEAEAVGGQFLAITELAGGMPAEMDLLRRAYSAMLG